MQRWANSAATPPAAPNRHWRHQVLGVVVRASPVDDSVRTPSRLVEFDVPGALVQLAGNYIFETEAIDFHGQLRLQAKLSQTQSGWKRIVLKPVDPFFSKEGAGTLLKIQVVGTRSAPQFGLDKKKDDKEAAKK